MRARGFTLIEVLVALLVVAVGLLAAAGLQARTQALRNHAALATQATLLAVSLAERMAANRTVMAGPDAANPYLQIDVQGAADIPAAPSAACLQGAACDPVALAVQDVQDVLVMAQLLPGARLRVCRDAGSAPSWECDRSALAPAFIKLGWRAGAGTGAVPPMVVLPVERP